jgi:hypothetical protein
VSRVWRSITTGLRSMSDRTAILIAVGVAIAMRLVLILSYPPLLSSDSGDYLDLAHRMASGNFSGWQARRTPGFPLLLLAVHYSATAMWVVQAVLGVVGTMLVYALIRLMRGSTRAALAGSLLYAASLEVLAVERVMLSEALTSFLLLAAAVSCAKMVRDGRASRPLIASASVLLLLACLTRPDSLVAAVVLAVITAGYVVHARGRATSRRGRLRGVAVMTAALLVPTIAGAIAWSSFNAATMGQFTTSTVIGFNMIDHVGPYVTPNSGPDRRIAAAYAATYRRSHAGFPSYNATPEIMRVTGLDAAQIGSRYLQIALRLAVAHPLGYVSSSLRQWVQAWRQPNYADGFRRGSLAGISRVLWGVERPIQILLSGFFLALCAVSVAVWVRTRRWLLSPAATTVAATALAGTVAAAFVGFTDPGRYAYPYMPLVFCVAVAFAGSAIRAAQGIRTRSRSPIWVESRDV